MRKFPNDPFDILLVEDNPGDVRLTKEALREGKIPHTLHVAGDGLEAIAFLKKEGAHRGAPTPDLILLDLNLPKMNGREVLAAVKNALSLKRIPITVLTTSKAEDDILNSYDLHANCYITKPVDMDQFVGMVRLLEEFWFCTVNLPPS